MRILQTSNECIESHLNRLMKTPPEDRTALNMVIKDFDDTELHMSIRRKELNVFWLSIRLGCFRQLQEMGVMEKLESVYGGLLCPQAANGYDVTLCIDLDAHASEEVVKLVSNLKGIMMSHAILTAWQMTESGSGNSAFKLEYRPGEPMWLVPRAGKLTIVIAVRLLDEDDVIIGKSFLQELHDFRDPMVTDAPNAGLSETEDRRPRLPAELSHLGEDIPEGTNYVVLGLDKCHFRTPAIGENSCSLIQNFRNFMHYHIKCCKANLHIRQRQSVHSLLQQLNRAKEENK